MDRLAIYGNKSASDSLMQLRNRSHGRPPQQIVALNSRRKNIAFASCPIKKAGSDNNTLLRFFAEYPSIILIFCLDKDFGNERE